MQLNRLLLLCILVFVNQISQAQVTDGESTLKDIKTDSVAEWKSGGNFTTNITQVMLTNWAAGGQSSMALGAGMNLFLNKIGPSNSFENNLDLGFGMLMQGRNNDILKTDDKIELNSKYGTKLKEKVYLAALLNFKTQFTAGYNYPDDSNKISNFMAPDYALAAIGLDLKPKKGVSLFVSPLTSKMTMVLDSNLANAGAFGVDAAFIDDNGAYQSGKSFRAEIGGYIRAAYTAELMENVNMTFKIDLFSNYLDNPGNVDMSSELVINMKVNKYLSANVTLNAIYDHDILIGLDDTNDGVADRYSPALQFKEVIGIGFAAQF